jgi:TRAP-type mannitol/chloroaromatic compound transport system substrate-binding protein
MLEKYKEVAYKILDGWHETEPGCKWMLTAGQRDDIWRDMKVILDSAFAEIEGGE